MKMNLHLAAVEVTLLLAWFATLSFGIETYTLVHVVRGDETEIQCSHRRGEMQTTWRKNGEEVPCTSEVRSGSLIILSPDFPDSGNYSCEWQSEDGPMVQHIWVVIVEILESNGDLQYTAKRWHNIDLRCCINPASETVQWQKDGLPIIDIKEKYAIDHQKDTLEIRNFQDNDIGLYQCIYKTPTRNFIYNHNVKMGNTVTKKDTCDDERSWTIGYERTISLRGLVKIQEVPLAYRKEHNDKESVEYKNLNQQVCLHLEELKRESVLGEFFKMRCEVMNVDPSTANVTVMVTVIRYYLLATGFSANLDDYGNALHFMLQERQHSGISYEFEVYKPQTNVIRPFILKKMGLQGIAEINCPNVEHGTPVTWRKNGELIRGLDSATLKLPCHSMDVAGNYTCETLSENEVVIQPIWVVIMRFSVPNQRVEYSAVRGSTAVLQCCGHELGQPPSWFKGYDEHPVESSEKYTINDKTGTLEIANITSDDAGAYYCTFYHSIKFSRYLHIGSSVDTLQSCDELRTEALGEPISLQLIGPVMNNGIKVVYKPTLNELHSNDRRELNRNVCSQLEDLRKGSLLNDFFKMECEVVEMHPITSAVITRVTVKADYLTTTGFEATEAGLVKALGFVLQRNHEQEISYDFQLYTRTMQADQSYEILFVEGFLYRDNQFVPFYEANEIQNDVVLPTPTYDVCDHIQQILNKDDVFNNCPISCTTYASKHNGKIVAQLSIYVNNLPLIHITRDERAIAKAFNDFFMLADTTIDDVDYSPQVLHPGVFAAGPIFRNRQLIDYNWEFRASEEYATLLETMPAHIKNTHPFRSPLDTVAVETRVEQFHWTKSHLIVSLSMPNKDLLRYSKVLDKDFNYLLGFKYQAPRTEVFFEILQLHPDNPVAEMRNTIATDSVTFLRTMEKENTNMLHSSSLTSLCDGTAVQYVRLDHTATVPRYCEAIKYGQSRSMFTQIMEVKKVDLLAANAVTHRLKPVWNREDS